MLAQVVKDKTKNWLEVRIVRQHRLRVVRALHCLELEEMCLSLVDRTSIWQSAFLLFWRLIFCNRVRVCVHSFSFFLNFFSCAWSLVCRFGWLGSLLS
jgi:hypothetical protein